jgi:hypothetical protein
MVDFFAPASVMWTFLSQIGHRNEKVGDLCGGPIVEAAQGVSRKALWTVAERARAPARLRPGANA